MNSKSQVAVRRSLRVKAAEDQENVQVKASKKQIPVSRTALGEKTNKLPAKKVEKIEKKPVPVIRKTVHKLEDDKDKHQNKKTRVETFDDLDKDDINDPLMTSEYVVEIYEYLKELEVILINLG